MTETGRESTKAPNANIEMAIAQNGTGVGAGVKVETNDAKDGMMKTEGDIGIDIVGKITTESAGGITKRLRNLCYISRGSLSVFSGQSFLSRI